LWRRTSGAAGCGHTGAVEAIHVHRRQRLSLPPPTTSPVVAQISATHTRHQRSYWNSSNHSAFGFGYFVRSGDPLERFCAGLLLSNYLGYGPTYGSTSLCNDALFGPFLMSTNAGGGGPSQCATGSPSADGVVGGSCSGWPKPSWQTVLGNPARWGARYSDVSLFAADGLWSHYYVFCWSDTHNGGLGCGSDPSAWNGAGGTSFASPVMAGIQALINQKAGGPQGNPRSHVHIARRCRVWFERQ